VMDKGIAAEADLSGYGSGGADIERGSQSFARKIIVTTVVRARCAAPKQNTLIDTWPEIVH